MGKDKKENKQIIKGIAILLAGTMVCTVFAGCSNKSQGQEKQPTSVSENQDQNNKDILFEREDGSYLQLLITYYKNTQKETYNIGYVTYNKDGVYFDNVESDVRVKLSDQSVFGDSVYFHYLQFSSLCDEQYLINGKISIDEASAVLNKIGYFIDGSNRMKFGDNHIDVHDFYPEAMTETLTNSNDSSTYSLGKEEPILDKINMYSDSKEEETKAYVKN